MTSYNITFHEHTDGNGHIELWQKNKNRKDPKKDTEIIENEFRSQREVTETELTAEKDDEGKSKKKSVTYVVNELQLFRFELKRQKSKISKKEQIEIEAYREGVQYGKIMANMMKLRDEFAEFKRYGVVLSRSLYNDISGYIESNYLSLQPNIIDFIETELTDSIVEDIFGMFCSYIKEYPFTDVAVDGKRIYPIPVALFDSYLEDSDYSRFGSTAVRKAFKGKYTHTNTGRNDYFSPPCGEEEKKFKSIAFIGELVDKRNNS